jgi:hypothetical protein
MKSDFMLDQTQLSAEKNLSKEVVLGAVESAGVCIPQKKLCSQSEISVKINSSPERFGLGPKDGCGQG